MAHRAQQSDHPKTQPTVSSTGVIQVVGPVNVIDLPGSVDSARLAPSTVQDQRLLAYTQPSLLEPRISGDPLPRTAHRPTLFKQSVPVTALRTVLPSISVSALGADCRRTHRHLLSVPSV